MFPFFRHLLSIPYLFVVDLQSPSHPFSKLASEQSDLRLAEFACVPSFSPLDRSLLFLLLVLPFLFFF
jgi:hypothetical protein